MIADRSPHAQGCGTNPYSDGVAGMPSARASVSAFSGVPRLLPDVAPQVRAVSRRCAHRRLASGPNSPAGSRSCRRAARAAATDRAARIQIERCHAADVRLRTRLGTLRADALAVRRIDRDGAALSYLGAPPSGSRLDIELCVRTAVDGSPG